MSDRIYKFTEIVGSSKESVEDAIEGAIKAASNVHDHVEWFEVVDVRGHIQEGKVGHYQVVLKVGYRL